MSAPKYAKRRDESELPAVTELKDKYGFTICRQLPVDTICLKWVTPAQLMRAIETRPDGRVLLMKMLEFKSNAKKDGTVKLRSDQIAQQKFCEQWQVPYVLSAFDGALALGEPLTLDP